MLLHLYILIKNWSHLFVQFIDVFPIFNKIYYFIAKYIVGIIIIIPLILLFWDIVLWKDNHFVLNWDYSFFQNPLLIEEYNCFTQYLNPSIVYGVNFEYMYSYFAMMFLFVLFFIYSFEFLLLSVLPFIAKDYISLLLWFLCFFGAFRFLIFIFNDGNLGLHFYQLTNEIHRNIDWLWVFENLLNKEWAEPEYQLFVAKVTFVAWRLHFSLLIFGLFMLLNRTVLWKKLQNRYTIFNNWSSKMVVQLESKPKSLIFGMVVGSIIFPYILGYIYSIILNIIVSISNICLKLLATILLGIVGLFIIMAPFFIMSILASGLWGDLAKAIGNSTGKVIQAFKRADPTTAIAGGLAGGGAISEAVRLARDVIAHREVNKMLDGAAETQTKETQLPRGVSRSVEVSEKGKAPVTRVYLAPGVKFEIIAPTTTKVEVFNSESGQLSASSSPVDSWLRHSSLMSNYTCNRLNLDRLPPKN